MNTKGEIWREKIIMKKKRCKARGCNREYMTEGYCTKALPEAAGRIPESQPKIQTDNSMNTLNTPLRAEPL